MRPPRTRLSRYSGCARYGQDFQGQGPCELEFRGREGGRILRVHTREVNYKGYVDHASRENPQYGTKGDKTEHVALHKGRTLRRLSR